MKFTEHLANSKLRMRVSRCCRQICRVAHLETIDSEWSVVHEPLALTFRQSRAGCGAMPIVHRERPNERYTGCMCRLTNSRNADRSPKVLCLSIRPVDLKRE